MDTKHYCCPICKTALSPNPRYPNYVCRKCYSKASDSSGKKLEFWNVSLSGGFKAEYTDTKEMCDSHTSNTYSTLYPTDETRFGVCVIEL